MSQELTEKQQLDFSTVYGAIFALGVTSEYLQSLQGLLAERNAKYALNKAREAEKSCEVILTTLHREMTKRMTAEEKAISAHAIEHHKNLIYAFFLLDPDQQRRVSGLITKLKSEKQ